MLVYTEGIKCFILVLRSLRSQVPLPVVKHFIQLAGEKYKAPKQKGFNSNVDQVFDDILESSCIGREALFDILAAMAENDKNLYMRIGVIQWLTRNSHCFAAAAVQAFARKAQGVLKKETNLRLKEACSNFLQSLEGF